MRRRTGARSRNLLARFARDEGGQSMVFVALLLLVLASVLALTLSAGRGLHRRILLQNAADGAALSGATWEARGLNLVAQMNEEMVEVMTLAVVVVGVAGLASFVPGGGMLQCYVPWILNKLYNVLTELSRLEGWVVRFWPPLVEASVATAARRDLEGVLAAPFPLIPAWEEEVDSAGRIGLHLSPSGPGEMVGEVVERAWSAADGLVGRLSGGAVSLSGLNRSLKGIFGIDLKRRFMGMVEGAVGAMSFEGGMRVSTQKDFAYGPADYPKAERVARGEWPDAPPPGNAGQGTPPCRIDPPDGIDWVVDRSLFDPPCTPTGCSGLPSRQERWRFSRSRHVQFSRLGAKTVVRRWTFAVLQGMPPEEDPALDPGKNPLLPFLNAAGTAPAELELRRECPAPKDRSDRGLPVQCVGERWSYAGLTASAAEVCSYPEERRPPGGVRPLRLHDDFEDRQWVAAVAYLKPGPPPRGIERWVPAAQSEWGGLAVARARVVTQANRPGGIPLVADFESRLTAFEGTAAASGAPGLLGKALERFEGAVLH